MEQEDRRIWRSPEEIVEIAFRRSYVVMMNEAHSGLERCIRTRQIGKRILPVAHQAGVRHLAMEALFPAFAEHSNRTRRLLDGDFGYLSQPEMKEFIQTALNLGWTLISYEADSFMWISERHGIDFTKVEEAERIRGLQEFQSEFRTQEFTNWREEQQALNIIRARQSLPAKTPLLVWCGNSHHAKEGIEEWLPMGYQFKKHSHIDPFVIDQNLTVDFGENEFRVQLLKDYADDLQKQGGTAGFLAEEAPPELRDKPSEDAYLLSTRNALE
jgi:hypothetical protein